jgi:hypothetical protein
LWSIGEIGYHRRGLSFTTKANSMTRIADTRIAGLAALLLAPVHAWAMSGSLVDSVADVLAVVVIVLVPVGGIYLFWMVHILPEKVAERRHHPQKDAIKTLCLLSLIFGGLLWPIAWLWAYSKPVMYKLAYGTDKLDDHYKESAPGVSPAAREVTRLRADIERLVALGIDAEDLLVVKRELARLEARLAGTDGKEAG